MTAGASPYSDAPRTIMSYSVNPWTAMTIRPASAADDVALHRPQRPQQILLGLGVDLVLVERLDQALHGSVPLGLGDLHAGVGRLHVLAHVGAGAATGLADLVGEVGLELDDFRRLHALEAGVDPAVGHHVGHEIVDDGRDPLAPAQALV